MVTCVEEDSDVVYRHLVQSTEGDGRLDLRDLHRGGPDLTMRWGSGSAQMLTYLGKTSSVSGDGGEEDEEQEPWPSVGGPTANDP